MRSEPRRLGVTATIALAASLGLATLLPARSAQAYCRTASCGNAGTGQICIPAQTGDCGLTLFWASPCVGYSIQQDASAKVSFDVIAKVMKASFATWETAACSVGNPRILVTELAKASCTKHEYNQNDGNTNLIVFRDAKWPYEGSSNTLALTTVTYNLDTGEIYDADMELNSADSDITTSDTVVDYDLQSITTHEAGHFLGLAHSATLDATMFPDYKASQIGLRTLDPDDVQAICAVYPASTPIPPACDNTPRHGFSTLCASDQAGTTTSGGSSSSSSSSSGCSVGSAATTSPTGAAALAAAMAALGIVARRRSRRARRSDATR
jgi:predicted Zn-dependent protease